jgi:ectoine hydroxylase-related dioxygenase (phytanoyl-CoA dioxygenase family)
MTRRVVTDQELESFERDGFFRIDGFAEPTVGEAMLERVIDLARRSAAGETFDSAFVLPESQPDMGERPNPEDLVSKIFRLARDTVFYDFAVSEAVTEIVADVLDADDVDNFLSQFIFKNRGAWGQPWHQDSFYFPFEPARPVVGIWLAVTEATLDNGCLWVLPGSHREPVHEHVLDRRPGANYGYVEIVDHDMSGSVPVLMQPGDLLVFDSHLMHRSTDNETDGFRAAMVYHYARAGTRDRTEELKGYTVNDWMPARRADRRDLRVVDA